MAPLITLFPPPPLLAAAAAAAADPSAVTRSAGTGISSANCTARTTLFRRGRLPTPDLILAEAAAAAAAADVDVAIDDVMAVG